MKSGDLTTVTPTKCSRPFGGVLLPHRRIIKNDIPAMQQKVSPPTVSGNRVPLLLNKRTTRKEAHRCLCFEGPARLRGKCSESPCAPAANVGGLVSYSFPFASKVLEPTSDRAALGSRAGSSPESEGDGCHTENGCQGS